MYKLKDTFLFACFVPFVKTVGVVLGYIAWHVSGLFILAALVTPRYRLHKQNGRHGKIVFLSSPTYIEGKWYWWCYKFRYTAHTGGCSETADFYHVFEEVEE